MHALADQSSRSIGTTQAAALIGAKRAHNARRNVGIRRPGGITPECRRTGVQSDRDTHDELLFGRAREAAGTQDTSPTVRSPVRPSQDDLTRRPPPPGQEPCDPGPVVTSRRAR
jgi:hypothetical protein